MSSLIRFLKAATKFENVCCNFSAVNVMDYNKHFILFDFSLLAQVSNLMAFAVVLWFDFDHLHNIT